MKIWLDAQLSPNLAAWISQEFDTDSTPVSDLGLRSATDLEIFHAARDADAVVVTKDRDFAHLVTRLGPPPRIIWLTCGNTSNATLQVVLKRSLQEALDILTTENALVEISDVLQL